MCGLTTSHRMRHPPMPREPAKLGLWHPIPRRTSGMKLILNQKRTLFFFLKGSRALLLTTHSKGVNGIIGVCWSLIGTEAVPEYRAGGELRLRCSVLHHRRLWSWGYKLWLWRRHILRDILRLGYILWRGLLKDILNGGGCSAHSGCGGDGGGLPTGISTAATGKK